MPGVQKPLELILARNLLSSLSVPAFLADAGGVMVFYNEAAGALLGRRFEEAGKMTPDEWGSTHGPFDENGNHIPYDQLSTTVALRDGRAAHSRYCIRSMDGNDHEIESSALPIVTAEGSRGAIVIFWPVEERMAEAAEAETSAARAEASGAEG